VVDGDDLTVVNVYREGIAEANLAEVIAEHILATEPNLVSIEEAALKQTATRHWCSKCAAWRVRGWRMAMSWACRSVATKSPGPTSSPASARPASCTPIRRRPWWPAFAAELASFPLGSADDQVGACAGSLSLALEHLEQRQTLETLPAVPVAVRQVGAVTGGWQPRVSTQRADVSD
jgi:hypothetical protein